MSPKILSPKEIENFKDNTGMDRDGLVIVDEENLDALLATASAYWELKASLEAGEAPVIHKK